jgi:hypothetical protein
MEEGGDEPLFADRMAAPDPLAPPWIAATSSGSRRPRPTYLPDHGSPESHISRGRGLPTAGVGVGPWHGLRRFRHYGGLSAASRPRRGRSPAW